MRGNKGCGTVVIKPAGEGWQHLIPRGWKLAKRIHRPFIGTVNVSACSVGDDPANGFVLLERDAREADKLGLAAGLHHVAALLARQKQEPLPKEWQQFTWLILCGTVLEDEVGEPYVPYLEWDYDREEWRLDFELVSSDFFDCGDAVLRISPVNATK